MNDIISLIKKDLLIEYRSRFALTIGLSFSIALVILEGIVFGGVTGSAKTTAALYWLTIYFSAMQFLAHLLIREREEGTFFILMTRFSAESVYLSKLAVNWIAILVVGLMLSALFAISLSIRQEYFVLFVLTSIPGLIATACATTFASSLASSGKGKNALFAVLTIPSTLPIMISSIHCTTSVLTGSYDFLDDIIFCAVYSVFITGLSLLLFKRIWKF